MANDERTMYLITEFEANGREENERLVNADTRLKAIQHCIGVNKASAADVARVLGAGGAVEEAA